MNKFKILKQRQQGICGLDVGAIMGVNKWRDAFEVYVEKKEKISESIRASEAEYWSKTLEEIVAKEFFLRTGKKVRRDNKFLIHKQYPFMVANIDRKIVGENAILKCIVVNGFYAKEWIGEDVPETYQVQCQHYLEVTGADICYIAVLIDGQRYLFKEVMRDQDIIEIIINAEKDFWENNILKGIPPIVGDGFIDVDSAA